MSLLTWVLRVKIFCTLILWSLPLLGLPSSWFVRMGMPEPRPMLFFRLLGAAYFALAVGYASGLSRLRRGGDVRNIVWMGIASNGAASLILLRSGIRGAWQDWGPWARIYMRVSTLLAASITAGLVVSELFRSDR